MVRAILFYESYNSTKRTIVKVIEDPLYLSKTDIEYYYKDVPSDHVYGKQYKPSLYMNYCGSDYLVKAGGITHDTENGKG